jgi:UDP-GlcNAc:undecaprenyl-phosphate GlcNAc-1-phosphate transferase
VIETTIAAALATFMAMVMMVYALRPLAARVGLVDRPDHRKQHEFATPAVGGLAILLALATACFAVLGLAPQVQGFASPQIQGFGLAALVIVAAGIVDDLYRLRWPYRLGAQVAAALILIHVGGIRVEHIGSVLGFPIASLGKWSELLTIVATVGIINAINMIDGVDGLAGSVTLAVTVMLAAVAAYAGNTVLAEELGLVAGALCGFLVYNLRTPWRPTASIFLGNAGSELLGLIIACASFRLTQNGHHPVGPQLAPFLVAPALIDCLTLIIRRLRGGVSPFMGDRNHLHHLLLDAGLTPSWVVAILTGATVLIGGLALLAMKAHVTALYFTLIFLGIWAAYFLASRRRDRSVAALTRLAGWLRAMGSWRRSRPATCPAPFGDAPAAD